jgi:hypothetical protein
MSSSLCDFICPNAAWLVAGSIAYDNIGFKYSTLVEALLMGLTVLVVAFVSTSKYYSCPRCQPVRDLEAIFQVIFLRPDL